MKIFDLQGLNGEVVIRRENKIDEARYQTTKDNGFIGDFFEGTSYFIPFDTGKVLVQKVTNDSNKNGSEVGKGLFEF